MGAQRVDALRIRPRGLRCDDERARDRLVQGLDEVAGPPRLDFADEPGALELLQVVVDLLAGQVEPAGDGRGRRRGTQRLEDVDPQRMQQHLKCVKLSNHVYGHRAPRIDE